MAASPKWELREGDCVTLLRSLPENSVDASVTDPPYGLEFMGKDWDRLQGGIGVIEEKNMVLPNSLGPRRNVKCPECGKWKWDWPGRRCECGGVLRHILREMEHWHLRWATEMFRVLKPGGHLLAFGGTRTYHRLASAIEDAGFEIRDTINWVHGQGFPKSLNLEAESEGWGTALKPSHELIVVARKPLAGTVAANVAEWGTGAMNVEATRVAGTVPETIHGASAQIYGGGKGLWPGGPEPFAPSPAGRWPPNLLLTHSPGCVRSGTRVLAGHPGYPNGPGGKSQHYSSNKRSAEVRPDPWPGLPDAESPAWTSAPTCPVAEMDRQSGERPVSGSAMNGRPALGDNYGVGNAVFPPSFGNRQGPLINDEGTASRFFPQFGWEAEEIAASFRYEAKASRAEREAGCEEVEAVAGWEAVDRKPDTAGLRSPRAGAGRTAERVHNNHPTVKPIALLRWLARLVTPPGGLLLDPFAGSGSGGAAAVLEGFRFLGIERDAHYCDIARHRIAYWAGPRAVAEETPGGRPRGRERSLEAWA